MRILIAGGFGFIGGRLALHLAQFGHEILLGSRSFSPPPEELSQAKVLKLKWDDEASLETSCQGVDIVIHAAGMNAQDCLIDPVAALSFNGLATAKFVSAASKAKVKQFIYISTAHIYSSPLLGVITESTYPQNMHPYATSHLVGEEATLNAKNYGETNGVVLRLSNAFGVPIHRDVNCWNLLINNLCRDAVKKRKLVLISNGLQHRDFISISDVCTVIHQLIILKEFKNLNLFNVGTGISHSILDIARLIQERCIKVLGYRPILKIEESNIIKKEEKIIYQSNNLKKLNIHIQKDINIKEIDRLIEYCKKNFS